jgi:hypothetical protein
MHSFSLRRSSAYTLSQAGFIQSMVTYEEMSILQ